MSHDILTVIALVLTIPLLAVVLLWSKAQIGFTKEQQDEFWERRRKAKEKILIAMLPHSIQIWRNLLYAVQNKESEKDIKEKTKEVIDYVTLMAKM